MARFRWGLPYLGRHLTNLLLRVEPHLGAPFERRAEGAPLVLGRSSSADIVVPDRFMSRLQARLFRERERLLLHSYDRKRPEDPNGKTLVAEGGLRLTTPGLYFYGVMLLLLDRLAEGPAVGVVEESLDDPLALLVEGRVLASQSR